MATTETDLYHSVMGGVFNSIKLGVYPGDGVLDSRWEPKECYSNTLKRMVTSQADVAVVAGGESGPEVMLDGGTSAHDVPGWFPTKGFFIPEGTE